MSLSKHHQTRKRALLALASTKLDRDVQQAALRACIQLRAPVDILLTDNVSEEGKLPAMLMLRLEHSGLDYRFARTGRAESEAIQRHLARGRGPLTVIVADARQLTTACKDDLRAGQHTLIDLSNPQKPGTPEPAPAAHTPPSKWLLA